MKNYALLQIIAGSDSCGGAGMQADIKTATVLGVYALSAITALTAQNTLGVDEIFDIDEKFVTRQLETNYSDMKFDTIKIGMLHKTSLIKEVKNFLQQKKLKYVVLDPVMVSASKAVLLQHDAITSLKEELFSLVDILTPNLHEANLLCSFDIKSKKTAQDACLHLASYGCKYVLIKSLDYEKGFVNDILYDKQKNEFSFFKHTKINTMNTHGTGCSLSSAIASFLSLGFTMKEAVKKANIFINEAIQEGSLYTLGSGNGPINHMYKL